MKIEISKTLKSLPHIDYRQLKELQGNLKDLSEINYNKLLKSLQEFGFIVPLFVWKDGKDFYIADGHQRSRVLKKENVTPHELPYIEIQAKDKQEAKRKLLVISSQYGKITQEGYDEFTFDIDADWLTETINFDALPLNWDTTPEAEEDNFEVPPIDEIKTDIVLGDLFQIGNHRLLCGDSTCSDTVAKLMNGEKADMVFTDPPYLGEMGRGGFSKDLKLQKSKDKKIDEIRSMYNFDPANTFPIIELFKKNIISVFLFCNKNLVPIYLNYAIDTQRLFDILTWHKTSFIPANNNTYFPDTEYLIKIKDKGASFKTGLKDSVNYGKYWVLNNTDKENHPTVKPQKIINDCLLICSNESDLILDLFLGSGSTMVAAHQLKRKCYGMELDPKYCQVILDRILKLAPDLSVTLNGNPYQPKSI